VASLRAALGAGASAPDGDLTGGAHHDAIGT